MARVAIVTGGTRGIGEAISVALKDMGMKVAANYAGNDERAREFTARTGIGAYKWDVSDFDACQEGVRKVEAEIGPVDVLVNNAGITRDSTMKRMDHQKWQEVIDTNLGGCFNMAKAVFEGMVLGKIVARIPVGRLGKADEIARGVAFLVDENAGFVTGSTLSINGGQHMY
jgi:acetoacetyl-CoA reductase